MFNYINELKLEELKLEKIELTSITSSSILITTAFTALAITNAPDYVFTAIATTSAITTGIGLTATNKVNQRIKKLENNS